VTIRSKDVRLPHYREKGGWFHLVLSTNAINIKNGFLTVPLSRKYAKIHNGHRIRIPVPDRMKEKTIQEVRICPMYGGRYFKIQYCYLKEPEPVKASSDRVLAIDLGLDNLAACVTNTGTSFLMDGRKLKSINQYWNKRKARLQSIAAKQGQKTTNQLCQLAKKRNFRMQDILRKTARYILDFCISHQIGTIVCGYNRDFKRGLKLGKVTNQHFAQINLSYLRSTLKHLCERYGITYLEQEESYTSQASCLDLDDIPVYQLDAPYTGTFSGKRIRRGLYRFANGRTANADINGAANILRKSKQNFDFEELCKGLLDSPLRIRLS
jgi:IS605 OrfB family transposase